MAWPLQQPCLVPACPEILLGLRGRKLKVCATHREATTVEVGGVPFRHCGGCNALHPTVEFSSSSAHICEVCEGRYAKKCRRLRRRSGSGRLLALTPAFKLPAWLPLSFGRAVKALATYYISSARADRDHGKEVCGLAVVAFLRGETAAAKVSLPVLYSAACCFLGPHKAETWASLALSASFLHLLLPYAHQHCYAHPLREVRQAAAQLGFAVSSSFQFLDPGNHLKYGEFVQGTVSSNYARLVGHMVGVFLAVAAPSMQAFAAVSTVGGASSAWTLPCFLVLVGMMYFPARLWGLAQRLHMRLQLLDAAMLVLGSSVPLLPAMYSWASGSFGCGLPAVFLSVGGELELAMVTLLLILALSAITSSLLDGPSFTVATVTTAVVTVLRASVILAFRWCIQAELQLSVFSLVPVLLIEAWVAGGMACTTLKIRQETAQLLRYVHQLLAKQAVPLDSRAIYQGDRHLLLAVKLGDATPAHLPFNLRDRLLSTMPATPESLTGVIRPGCVLLGLEIRFRSSADMRSAWASLLSHCNWSNTLLDSTSSAIDLSIHGSPYTVKEGQLQHRLPGIQGTSMIAAVEPLAPSPSRSTLLLRLSRLEGRTFKVLLRCSGRYYELEVAATSVEDSGTGLSTAVVRLPDEAGLDGLGWVEVMVDTSDGSLVMSQASPVLFTSLPEVAEELSRMLTAHCPDDSQFVLAGLLADLATFLQDQSAVPPLLLLHVVELGLTECFKRLTTSAAALRDADRQGQGLLGSAVLSGSEEVVDLVMSTMDEFNLPVNPCQRAPDARGYTALHWAADSADVGLVYSLLAEVRNPLKSWKGCKARECGQTPAELMAKAGAAFAINEEILKAADEQDGCDDCDNGSHELAADAVWGADVAAALGRNPLITHASLVALYGALCAHLGWRDPLAWWTVALTCVSLHVLLPNVYTAYLKGLAEVRGLAAEQGLSVSWAYKFIGAAEEQGMYEQFAAHRAAMKLPSISIFTAATVLAMSAPWSQVCEHWGVWRHTPMLLSCGVLVSLQACAILTPRLQLWQWLELAMAIYYFSQAGFPVIAWATSDPDYCMTPPSMLLYARDNHFMLGLQPAVIAALMATLAMLSATVPKAPGAPVRLAFEIPIILFCFTVAAPAGEWCVASGSGLENLANLKNVVRAAFGVFGRLLVAAVRVQSEKQSLCAFLTSKGMRSDVKGREPCE